MDEEYCPAHVYRSFEEFHGFDDLDTRFIVVDWEMGRKSFMWGNRALLRAFNMTQAELNAWNFQDQSPAATEHHRSVWQAVQVEKGRIERMKTAYPKGKPVPAIQSFRPIEMQLADWPEQRTVMLMELKEPPETPTLTLERVKSCDDSKKNTNWGFAEELLRYTEVMTMVFDAKTEEMEYANQSCRNYYSEHENVVRAAPGSLCGGDAFWTMAAAFESFCFEDDAATQAALQQIRALTLTSPRLEFECQKTMSGKLPNSPAPHKKEGDSVRWHALHVQACLNPATGQPALIFNEYDVTTLKVQAEQLVAASQSQEQFFAAISHELRTPLNGIIGLSESMLSSQKHDERMEVKLQLIRTSGLRLNNLVNDILDAASAKRATFVVKTEPVDLLPICQNVVGLLSPMIPRGAPVVLRNDVDPELPLIRGDKDRITQILLNLVSNAIKFTETGSVTLSAASLHDYEILVEVTDTGIGIPQDKLEQVWAPFKQVDMSTTRKYGGTGLGLSLVREMVEAHGGRVGVHSQHGGPSSGTTFFFVLPISQPETLQIEEPSGASNASRPPSRTVSPVETAEILAEYKAAQLSSPTNSMRSHRGSVRSHPVSPTPRQSDYNASSNQEQPTLATSPTASASRKPVADWPWAGPNAAQARPRSGSISGQHMDDPAQMHSILSCASTRAPDEEERSPLCIHRSLASLPDLPLCAAARPARPPSPTSFSRTGRTRHMSISAGTAQHPSIVSVMAKHTPTTRRSSSPTRKTGSGSSTGNSSRPPSLTVTPPACDMIWGRPGSSDAMVKGRAGSPEGQDRKSVV